MNFENILVEKRGALAQITINRPKKLNALNKQTIAELHVIPQSFAYLMHLIFLAC